MRNVAKINLTYDSTDNRPQPPLRTPHYVRPEWRDGKPKDWSYRQYRWEWKVRVSPSGKTHDWQSLKGNMPMNRGLRFHPEILGVSQ